MMRFLGWLVFIFALFCGFGVIVDWVELYKHTGDGKSEFCLIFNHGKVVTDVESTYKTVEGWFHK